MERRRVVITGLGAITPVGLTAVESWQAVKDGACGIAPITQFDPSDMKVKLAAEVKDFVPENYLPKPEIKRMGRFTQFAVVSAMAAMADANFTLDEAEADRCGVIVSSGIGGLSITEAEHDRGKERGWDRVSPFYIPTGICNMAAGQIAIRAGFRGMCSCPVTACTGGTNAVGDAFHYIRDGYADVMLCGGTESAVTPLAIGGFLLGNIVSGLLLALFMSNAGGLWDNTKKYIEAGAEGGKAVADILYGKVSPSGRLPVTFYHNDSELPRFTDYSMKGRTYKYFQGKPLYPFAHGLSYTEFAYENLAFDGANVTGTVKNTGAMASGHAIPVFVKDPEEEGVNCRLAGFSRVELEPGQEAGFQVELCPEILSLFQEPQRLMALVGGVDGCQVNR